MDFSDSTDVAEFRAALRAWLTDHLAEYVDGVGADTPEATAATQRWHRALAEAGYVAVSLDVAYGGRGLPAIYEGVVNEELAAAQAPPPPPIGHIAHAIADFADPGLRERVLPGLLRCMESWCQGFSEPGAGSDLAGISTVATPKGDEFVVNGQKIWTSGALWADRCLLLCRTELEQSGHRGLSMLVVDMDSPAITRRAIALSNGAREFAEVYFDDVVVPASNVVGGRGMGWQIAMHMLTYVGGAAGRGWTGRLGNVLSLAREAISSGRLRADDTLRRRLAAVAADVSVLQWHVSRSLANRDGTAPGTGSIDKLLTTRVEQELYRVLADLAGAGFVVGDQEGFSRYLWSRTQSIYGGTQQVQRQIVAQRILGLPRG